MELKRPFLLFLGDVADDLAAKTAFGIVDWRRDWCVGQLRLPGCKPDCSLPEVTAVEARARGAQTAIIAVANAGGVLPEHWVGPIVGLLEAGLDVASGLHVRLEDIPAIADAARRCARELHNVRMPGRTFATGNGLKRRGKRLLTVGTDCSIGKKYTALAIERAMRTKGMNADFRATGQTGIFISGRGVAVDAVVSDFISGAAEWISPAAESDDHWDVIEGQGSLFHPSFAGVTLGLLHGSQPDAIIVCHEPGRTNMRGVRAPLPTIRQVIDLSMECGKLTNPTIRCLGISVVTHRLPEVEAREYIANVAAEFDLPVTDPIRFGVDNIVDRLQREF